MKRARESDMSESKSKKKRFETRIRIQSSKTGDGLGESNKCNICKQTIDNIIFHSGNLNNSCAEAIALTDERLSLFTGEEESIPEGDDLPFHQITYFSVYDNNGHLCPLDAGLVEQDVRVFVSGYIKPISDEDPSEKNGAPAHDVGPIDVWYITGFDGGEKARVGIVTPYAEYLLMEPAPEYAAVMRPLNLKSALLKLVIEFITDGTREDLSYEALLAHMANLGNTELTEDFLLQHAQFICDQIYSFDQNGRVEDDEKLLVTVPCVRSLVQLCAVTFRKRKKARQQESKITGPGKRKFTKAVTTPLVSAIFENFFPDQIERNSDKKERKKKRCGVCDACQAPDCGQCRQCKSMVKFGGNGRGKQACKSRNCPNMAVEEAELSENEIDDAEVMSELLKKKHHFSKRSVNSVEWCGESVTESKGRQFYDRAIVGEMEIRRGDCVMLKSENANEPLYIAEVAYMFEKFPQGPTVHAKIFYRGNDTFLGETANPQELYVVYQCEDCPLGSIVKKAEVTYKKVPEDWRYLGGVETSDPGEIDEHKFFYNMAYEPETARFTYITQEKIIDGVDSCSYCWKQSEDKKFKTPILNGTSVNWRNETYQVGTTVFLDPSVYKFRADNGELSNSIKSVDEEKYTEYYRKNGDVKGSNLDTSEPFCIGQIEEICEKKNDIKLAVRLFCRPENTRGGDILAFQSNINLVFWTDEVITASFDKVAGKCYLRYCDIVDSAEWCEKGPYRFYFTQAYDLKNRKIVEVPNYAKTIGYSGKGKGKGKGKSKTLKEAKTAPDWPSLPKPLKCMDVFAGCGGLSEGLHQAGIATTKWAIEKEPSAAQAFKLNNRDCKIFTGDANEILNTIMSGEDPSKGLPSKGDVDLLVGGPPCQGFSGMNRFGTGEYSFFKNSLIVNALSYCDFLRPDFFVMENVRNFVSFKRSMVITLVKRCLLAIGYQVTFGVLQAGHYGVPQTRRRMILIAAAPGIPLPKLPEPQHVFNKRGCQLSLALRGVKYSNGNLWNESAPYRTICVRDAISDLPEIKNGWNQSEMPYDDDATSHFQKKLRGNDPDAPLVDHICKEMAPIVEARIANIPQIPGSDWRDLPNICVRLSDGTATKKLQYPYCTKKQKKGEPNRGVCRCSTGKPCDPSDRQVNTLIPWCLPHTADRHCQWAGLYGRLEWDGYFGTTITNPEPMGKQGRVLHPEQNRVVSVRECARSQGFPDHFKFYGSVMDKHRQVGNAVPPPMGKAIGLEILKAVVSRNNNQ